MGVAAAEIEDVVLDASPLLSLLVVQFASRFQDPRRQESILSRSRITDHLARDLTRQRAALELSNFIQIIRTTSHVIGELRGLDSLKDTDRSDFWIHSVQWLRTKGLDEKLVQLMALSAEPSLRNLLGEFGHADIGVTQVARALGLTLITDDGALAAFAGSQSVRCIRFAQLINDYVEI